LQIVLQKFAQIFLTQKFAQIIELKCVFFWHCKFLKFRESEILVVIDFGLENPISIGQK